MSSPAEVWSYRNLIVNLAQRDLRARYKKSVLGWLWSLINPASTLAIYTLVFGVFLKGTAPVAGNGKTANFALYLFCGLVVWNVFQGTINNAISSFMGSGGLLTRTYFPPETPMVAGLGTVMLQAGLEFSILMLFMVIVGNVSWTFIVALPVLFLAGVFAFGIGLILGLGNIRFRDVAYLVTILLQVGFYLTPIVYRMDQLSSTMQNIIRLNPLTAYVNAMRQTVYNLDLPTTSNWVVMGVSSVSSLIVGWWVFSRYAPRVIEEL